MSNKRLRRTPDPFAVLLIVVSLGMALTLAFQIEVYYGADSVPIAKQTPAPAGFGG